MSWCSCARISPSSINGAQYVIDGGRTSIGGAITSVPKVGG